MLNRMFQYIDVYCKVNLLIKNKWLKGHILEYREEGIILRLDAFKRVEIEYKDIREVRLLDVSYRGEKKGYNNKDISIGLRDYYVERLGGSKKVRKMVQEWIMKEAMIYYTFEK